MTNMAIKLIVLMTNTIKMTMDIISHKQASLDPKMNILITINKSATNLSKLFNFFNITLT
jgi:hypothetical protein